MEDNRIPVETYTCTCTYKNLEYNKTVLTLWTWFQEDQKRVCGDRGRRPVEAGYTGRSHLSVWFAGQKSEKKITLYVVEKNLKSIKNKNSLTVYLGVFLYHGNDQFFTIFAIIYQQTWKKKLNMQKLYWLECALNIISSVWEQL